MKRKMISELQIYRLYTEFEEYMLDKHVLPFNYKNKT